jgi:hypothetical protein
MATPAPLGRADGLMTRKALASLVFHWATALSASPVAAWGWQDALGNHRWSVPRAAFSHSASVGSLRAGRQPP